jgi:FkbM family methyltransferase
MNSFSSSLDQVLASCRGNNFTDNWDHRRFGPPPEIWSPLRLKELAKPLLATLGLARNGVTAQIRANEKEFGWLFDHLLDAESKEVLLKVLAFRMLGHRKVKLPLNTPDYWAVLEDLDGRAEGAESLELDFLNWRLSKLNLAPEGYPMELFVRPSGVYTQFLLQQYRCQLAGHVIEAEAGDTIIDAGGCYGDTALYFSHKAGPAGKVYSFEFMADNVAIFNRNMSLNPQLAHNIELIIRPLWSASDVKLYMEGNGPGACVTPMRKRVSAHEVSTLSIDDLVQQECLPRIDFIKMDIEGAELHALRGAVRTIQRYRPKLAISVYHRLRDFWTIPQWIEGLDLGYHFYLRHFTIHADETVLFASADR